MIAGLFKRCLRSAIRSPAFSTFAAVLDTIADRRQNLLRVLTYHRIGNPATEGVCNPVTLSATPNDFNRQMNYLARRCRVIDLQDVLACLDGESTLPPRSVLITFDDAYKDFLQHAWPVLSELKLPVTLFVPTGFPDNAQRSFWWDRLYQCVHADRSKTVLSTTIGEFRLASECDRRQTLAFLSRHYQSMPADDAETFLDDLCRQVPVGTADNGVLGWTELRQLAADGVTLGAHTRTHPFLNRMTLSQSTREIAGSIDDLRRETGVSPLAFAYPGGALRDETVRIVGENGIRLAFTTCRGVNDLHQFDPLRIRRINIGRTTSVSLLRVEMRPGFRFLNAFWSRPAASSR